MNARLVYLALEAPREGSASYTHVHEIIRGLKKRGWLVDLYQPSYTKALVSPGLLMRLLLSFLLQLHMWVKWKRGSVLYIRGHYLAFPSAVVARIFRVPIFHEINGPYEDVFIAHPGLRRFQRILIPMQRLQYCWASGLIAVTELLCQWAGAESGGTPCALISNGANTDLFNSRTVRPAGLPDCYAIFFGGLAHWHGVPVMLDAIGHPDWPCAVHLVVIGEGACSEMLKARAAQDPRIHVMGRLPYKDIPSYVAHAVAGLVPISNPEGRSNTGLFPLKLFETLACATPAIVTDFPGQADLVRDNQCGIVIPVDDHAALARAVGVLHADPVLRSRMGVSAERLILSAHSWDIRAGATDQLIKKFLANPLDRS